MSPRSLHERYVYVTVAKNSLHDLKKKKLKIPCKLSVYFCIIRTLFLDVGTHKTALAMDRYIILQSLSSLLLFIHVSLFIICNILGISRQLYIVMNLFFDSRILNYTG